MVEKHVIVCHRSGKENKSGEKGYKTSRKAGIAILIGSPGKVSLDEIR